MALQDQLNLVNCGGATIGNMGTGSQGCKFDWDRVKTIEFSGMSYKYPTTDLNLAGIKEAQQKEEVYLISDVETFKLVPVEPTVNTSEGSGEENVTGELPYKYELMFKNKGMNFWKALRKFNTTKSYNVAFYDINGSKIMTQTKSSEVKGFFTNMIHTGQYKGKEGDTPAEFKTTIQLASQSIKEMESAVWVDGDNVDYSISDLDGYNDIIFTAKPLSVGATTLVIDATLVDRSHFPAGLVLTDFLVKKDGLAVVATAVTPNENDKTYSLTIPASTAGVYTVETKNSFGKRVVLQIATGLLFKSNVASAIVA